MKYQSGTNRSYDINVWFRGWLGITLETDDIVDFSSFLKGKEILKNIKL